MVGNSPQILDLKSYIKDYLNKNPDTKISIGCDSIQRRSDSVFAVVILLIPPFHKGGHVLYTKDFEARKKFGRMSDGQIFERLSGEALRSIELYNYLTESGILINSIELDYQKTKPTKSQSAFGSYCGWIASLGCLVLGKDGRDELFAVRAADSLVNQKKKRFKRLDKVITTNK